MGGGGRTTTTANTGSSGRRESHKKERREGERNELFSLVENLGLWKRNDRQFFCAWYLGCSALVVVVGQKTKNSGKFGQRRRSYALPWAQGQARPP